MLLTNEIYQTYVDILHEELTPALARCLPFAERSAPAAQRAVPLRLIN